MMSAAPLIAADRAPSPTYRHDHVGFKPMTPLDVVLPYTPFAMSADAEKRVKLLKDTHAYASELLRLAKDRMAHSDREPVEVKPGYFVYLVTKGLRIHQ